MLNRGCAFAVPALYAASSSRLISNPRRSSVGVDSRRELVIRRPSDSFSITDRSGWKTVRSEDVGYHCTPCGPSALTRPDAISEATRGRETTDAACHG